MSGRLVWVNPDSTVLIERFEDGSWMNVATRSDSDEVWGPPMRCHADAETAKIMSLAKEVSSVALAQVDDEIPDIVPSGLVVVAVDLCRGALGDDQLWAATAGLREALSDLVDDQFPWNRLP